MIKAEKIIKEEIWDNECKQNSSNQNEKSN